MSVENIKKAAKIDLVGMDVIMTHFCFLDAQLQGFQKAAFSLEEIAKSYRISGLLPLSLEKISQLKKSFRQRKGIDLNCANTW